MTATVSEGQRRWATVKRPNVMIKVPGTVEGAKAVERLTAEGVNVNITLLFSIDAYARVIRDLSTVYSIGYRPANRGHGGAWHNVTLQLVSHPELEVHSKRGYFEPKQ